MAIVIRKQGGKWEKTDKVIFADEAQLQRLLYESPELIPTKVEDQAAVFTREAGLPGTRSGSHFRAQASKLATVSGDLDSNAV